MGNEEVFIFSLPIIFFVQGQELFSAILFII